MEEQIGFDQQERHYIGDLLDDEANSRREGRRGSLSGNSSKPHASISKLSNVPPLATSQPIGPSPNPTFWPEPPPPYSPPLDFGKFGGFLQNSFEIGEWKGTAKNMPPHQSHSRSPLSIEDDDLGGISPLLPPLPSFTSMTSQVEEIKNSLYDESSLLNPFKGIMTSSTSSKDSTSEELSPLSEDGTFAGQHILQRSVSAINAVTPREHSMGEKAEEQEKGFCQLFRQMSEAPLQKIPSNGKSYRDVASNVGATAKTTPPQRTTSTSTASQHNGKKAPLSVSRPTVRPKAALSSPTLSSQTANGKLDNQSPNESTAKKQIVGFNPVANPPEKKSLKKANSAIGVTKEREKESGDFQQISSRKKKNKSKQQAMSALEGDQLKSEEELIFLANNSSLVDSASRFEILSKIAGGLSPQKTLQSIAQRRSLSAGLGSRKNLTGSETLFEPAQPKAGYEDIMSGRKVAKAVVSTTPRLSTDSGKGIFPFARRIVGAGDNSGSNGRRRKKDRKQSSEIFVVSILSWLLVSLFVIARKGAFWIINLLVDFVVLSCVATVVALRKVAKFCMETLRWLVEKIYDFARWIIELFESCKALIQVYFAKKCEDTFLGFTENIMLPTSCEEILERLYFAEKTDAYAILGLRADCALDDIRCYHKRQMALLKGDKMNNAGLADAMALLSMAFSTINSQELRQNYAEDFESAKAKNMELLNLLRELRRNINRAPNYLQCECGDTHSISRVPDCHPLYARYCRKCATKHVAKNHDIWAETRFFGFFWSYFACLNGVIYDITTWADCSANHLKHMKANSHTVQYRLHNITTTSEPVDEEGALLRKKDSKKQRCNGGRNLCSECASRSQSSKSSGGRAYENDTYNHVDDLLSGEQSIGLNLNGTFVSVSTNAVATNAVDIDPDRSKKAGRRRRIR